MWADDILKSATMLDKLVKIFKTPSGCNLEASLHISYVTHTQPASHILYFVYQLPFMLPLTHLELLKEVREEVGVEVCVNKPACSSVETISEHYEVQGEHYSSDQDQDIGQA